MKPSASALLLYLSLSLMRGVAHGQEAQPETRPSATVTAKVPPRYHDPYTYVPVDPLLKNTTTDAGAVYHNDFFDFAYRLPRDWVAEDIQITLKRNAREKVRAEPPGSSLTAQTVRILGPVLLLNATPRDVANRERVPIPCISMNLYSGPASLSVEGIREGLQSGDAARKAHGINWVSGPVEISVHGRAFFRADFSETRDNSKVWHTIFRTKIHGGVLTVDIRAGSKPEIEQIITTIQSIIFDEEPNSSAPNPETPRR